MYKICLSVLAECVPCVVHVRGDDRRRGFHFYRPTPTGKAPWKKKNLLDWDVHREWWRLYKYTYKYKSISFLCAGIGVTKKQQNGKKRLVLKNSVQLNVLIPTDEKKAEEKKKKKKKNNVNPRSQLLLFPSSIDNQAGFWWCSGARTIKITVCNLFFNLFDFLSSHHTRNLQLHLTGWIKRLQPQWFSLPVGCVINEFIPTTQYRPSWAGACGWGGRS